MTFELNTVAPSKLRWFHNRLRIFYIVLLLLCGLAAWILIPVGRQIVAVNRVQRLSGYFGYHEKSSFHWAFRNILPNDFVYFVDYIDFSSRSKLSDSDLECLAPFSQLERLYLQNTKVTDAGLVHLTGLTELDLSGTLVSDVGIVTLKCLSQLREIKLQNTKITDASLLGLQGQSQLTVIYLDGSLITTQGLDEFKRILPKCRIHYNGRTYKE